jgi:hypothetical protein
MLQEQGIPAPTAGVYTNEQAPAKDISGRRLRRRLRKGLSSTHRALLAYELEAGSAWIHHLTRRDACVLTGASASYVATLHQASDEERGRIKSGQLALSVLHNNKPPSDAYLDRLVVKAGADRVMAALDRYTRPQFKFAAE